MINLIDITYFYGDLVLPFSDADSLARFFTNYSAFQRKILVDALGESLYIAFEADFSAGASGSPQTQKYINLLSGENYTIDYSGDFTIKYPGIVDSTNHISFLAYFYYYEQFKSNTKLTKTGWINEDNENSAIVRSDKVIDIYNRGVELYGEVEIIKHSTIDELWNLDKGMEGLPYFGTTPFGTNITKSKLKGNLYNYVNQMRIDEGDDYYPQWMFTMKSKIDAMNI